MKLLLFNLATDADDPILGFTTGWINRLAAHYERVDVITMRAGRLAVSENVSVYSVGKEKGYSEARRAVEFYRILLRLLRRQHYDACFAHMMPLFAFMGAPLLKLRRVPITLWYAHRHPHPTVKWGMWVSRRVVTSVSDSFPFQTPKLRIIGQGIDTDFFAPDPNIVGARHVVPLQDKSIVHVARLMPIKHQATLLRAVAAVPGTHAVFVGDVPPAMDTGYRTELEQLAQQLGIVDRVTFAGSQLAEGVRDAYRSAAAAVNLSPPGLFDKAALEGMAMGLPVIVSNAAFDALLGEDAALLRIPAPDDDVQLAERLRALFALSEEQRAAIGQRLRARVIAAHSFDTLIPRLVKVLNGGEAL
jgi:glycosyltransferase involved in cell wall biosynthesis